MRRKERVIGMKAHPKLIIFDLDGVIFRGQYLLRLSRRVSLPGWFLNIYRCLLYEMGMLSIDVLLRDVYSGFKGIPLSTLREVYGEMPIINGAREAMKDLKSGGYEPAIVSSGVPDFVVRDVAGRLGIDLGFGPEVSVSGGTLSGEIGGVLAHQGGKSEIVEGLLRDRGLGWEDVIVVADDRNNLNIMKKAGISIGVNACYPVRKCATYLADSGDLREVVGFLETGGKEVDIWEGWLQEARRKLLHVFAAAVPFVAGLAPVLTVVSLCVMAVIYTVSEWTRLSGRVFPLVGDMSSLCLRKREKRYFVLAPITLTLGVVSSLIIFPREVAVAVILIIAFADSAAALVGRAWGTWRIPYNRSKSVQGLVAAMVVAFLCSAPYLSLTAAVVAALASSLIESLPIRDDNVTVPVGTGIILTAMV